MPCDFDGRYLQYRHQIEGTLVRNTLIPYSAYPLKDRGLTTRLKHSRSTQSSSYRLGLTGRYFLKKRPDNPLKRGCYWKALLKRGLTAPCIYYKLIFMKDCFLSPKEFYNIYFRIMPVLLRRGCKGFLVVLLVFCSFWAWGMVDSGMTRSRPWLY